MVIKKTKPGMKKKHYRHFNNTFLSQNIGGYKTNHTVENNCKFVSTVQTYK